MTNQESIECTCEVDCQVEPCCGLTSHKIIHGPCHSPGPEVWAALERLEDAASAHEALQDSATSPHVGVTQPITVAEGNALVAALAQARKLLSTRKEKV